MSALNKQQITNYKRDRSILIQGIKESIYVIEVISISVIIRSTLWNPQTIKFRSDLGFSKLNLILKKKQSIVIEVLKAFSAGKIELQHKTLANERVRADMSFSEQKLVAEIDAKVHTDRNQNKEN